MQMVVSVWHWCPCNHSVSYSYGINIMFDISKIKCPKIAVDAIIQIEGTNNVVLIKRKFPPLGLALPGGFVDYGESLEKAVVREVLEETNLWFEINEQLSARSDPNRDPRGHIISIPFWGFGKGEPKALDDAKELIILRRTQLMMQDFAFEDHKQMVLEYIFACD